MNHPLCPLGRSAIALASLLALTACGDDAPSDDAGMTGQMDASVPDDMGQVSVDMGTPDMGTPDMGTPDTGMPDMGGGPTIAEGQPCTVGGTACERDLECVQLSPDAVDPENRLFACLASCTGPADCVASTITPPARTCSLNGYCVQELATEGRITDFLLDDVDDRLVGCPEGTTPFRDGNGSGFLCLRPCDADGDCASGSELTPPANICFNRAADIYGEQLGLERGVCVQELSAEGDLGRVFRPNEEAVLAGCEAGLTPFEQFGVVNPIFGYEFGCVRECSADAECTGPDLGFCNQVVDTVFTSTNAISGICTTRRRTAGEPCSRSDIRQMCSTDANRDGNLFCVDGFQDLYRIDFDVTPRGLFENDRGYCQELCGNLDFDDATPFSGCANPARSCVVELPTNMMTTANVFAFNVTQSFQIRSDANLGLCTNDCDDLPDTCTEPGFSCDVQVGPQMAGGPNQLAFCVGTSTPTLPMWDPFASTPPVPSMEENCAGRGDQCPEDAVCLATEEQNGFPINGGCVFFCRLAEGDTDCAGKTANGSTDLECARGVLTNTTLGICLPRAP